MGHGSSRTTSLKFQVHCEVISSFHFLLCVGCYFSSVLVFFLSSTFPFFFFILFLLSLECRWITNVAHVLAVIFVIFVFFSSFPTAFFLFSDSSPSSFTCSEWRIMEGRNLQLVLKWEEDALTPFHWPWVPSGSRVCNDSDELLPKNGACNTGMCSGQETSNLLPSFFWLLPVLLS